MMAHRNIDQFRDTQAIKVASLYPFKEMDRNGEVLTARGKWLGTCMRMKAGIGLEPGEYNKLSMD